jgi:tricorn protease
MITTLNGKSVILFLSLLAFASVHTKAINTNDTRMLQDPAISQNHIAFIYANDLWVADRDGSNPRRLTASHGNEYTPAFSPDGKLIAFTGNYDGNSDVYIIPVEGGIPKRLTYHPGQDGVREFTPDGKSVLFFSQRELFTNRYTQLFTVSVETGEITKLKIPNGFKASYNADASQIAYTPIPDRYGQWKNYRGGTQTRIWIFQMDDNSVVEIPKPEGGSNDSDPMWLNGKVYFNSDRNGEFNLFVYDPADKTVNQLTKHEDFPVLNPQAGDGGIVYEHAGYLHFMDAQGSSTKLTIGVFADLLELRPRYATGSQWMRSMGISPTGVRIVMDYRGDIVTVPVENGDFRNLTQTQGAHETSPSWSPDGKWIAYISDESGENQLRLIAQDGKEKKEIKLKGNGFYAYPQWSPNSKKLTYVDNGRVLYLLDIASGKSTEIDADEVYVPGAYRQLFGDWSGDSDWIVYTKILETNFEQVMLYHVSAKKSYPVSDGMSDATSPTFDRDGKYLYFLASTDAGPVVNWFDQSTADMEAEYTVYMATLTADEPSPYRKMSDEEEVATDEEKEKEEDKKDKSKDDDDETWTIDVENIDQRIIAVPLEAGNYTDLNVDNMGNVLYIDRTVKYSDQSKLYKYNNKEQEAKELGEVDFYALNDKGDKIVFYLRGQVKAGEVSNLGDAKSVNTNAVKVLIDPAAEWAQILDEVWRVNRDYFYDPGMHGADWDAMKDKYAAFLPDLACRNDLNRLIRWMCSELSVGHSYSGGGDQLHSSNQVPGGLLGCDFSKEDGRYRFKKIYGGLNWNPGLRSPLTEPGVNVQEGEYLLAVNGKEVSADDNVFSFFENTAGMITEITVGSSTKLSEGRTVQVVPLSSDYSLRNRDWVEGNLKYVTEKTDGQVAYVYVPNTAGAGHAYFKRYFFPQANRKAIILDERFNGGGLLADYYIDILLRPYQSHWNFRYGKDLKTPSASIQGPKVMLIDETAGSGGDMLPYMFRKFDVGTMVGKRTWGGLVGILGFPTLLDGGFITAPNVAIWTEDGFIVENVGVAPDVEVEQTPADVIAGKDPQLDKAIELIMQELKENPVEEPKRPPYPKRAR